MPLPDLPASAATAAVLDCRRCRRWVKVHVFPALWLPQRFGTAGEAVLADEECACFYHSDKRAVRACDQCGRFICALCEIEMGENYFCPSCLGSGSSQAHGAGLMQRRFMLDNIALALAIIPVLTIWLTAVSAPATLFMVIKFWHAPRSLVRHSRWRMGLAGLLAVGQIIVWIIVISFLVRS